MKEQIVPPITYVSDQPQHWAQALHAATSLAALRAVTIAWKEFAADANEITHAMSDSDFEVWREGLAKERRGEYAGDDFSYKYGALMMPEVLFKVSVIADRFKVPWGAAYLRMRHTEF